jgi:four helix bundle protein
MKTSRNFRDYKVWQDAVAYASEVYKASATLPYFERKGLCDQLQRAVVSISSNIAEGSARPSDADFAHFLDTALGSAYEVETQLLIAKNVGYIEEELFENLKTTVINIEQQITNLISYIRRDDAKQITNKEKH